MPTTPPTRSPILAVFAVAVALIVALVQLDFVTGILAVLLT